MLDVMIDLETMGDEPNAAIIAIGAVEFDYLTQDIGERFYTVVDLASAVECGGVINADTCLWWMRQSDDARAEFNRKGDDLIAALEQFSCWMQRLGDRRNIQVWGNGADFDNVILASAFRRVKIQLPWDFRNNRCYRTVKNLCQHIKMQRSGIHHNAVNDAASQAIHLMEMLVEIPIKRQTSII